MRGRVVHRLTNRAHRHGRTRVRVKIPSGRRDYPPMGGLRVERYACAGGLQTWNPSCWLSSVALGDCR